MSAIMKCAGLMEVQRANAFASNLQSHWTSGMKRVAVTCKADIALQTSVEAENMKKGNDSR